MFFFPFIPTWLYTKFNDGSCTCLGSHPNPSARSQQLMNIDYLSFKHNHMVECIVFWLTNLYFQYIFSGERTFRVSEQVIMRLFRNQESMKEALKVMNAQLRALVRAQQPLDVVALPRKLSRAWMTWRWSWMKHQTKTARLVNFSVSYTRTETMTLSERDTERRSHTYEAIMRENTCNPPLILKPK